MQGYTAETVIVGRALQKDFEQRGVHLDGHSQSKALQMSQQIAVMGMQIGQSQPVNIDSLLLSQTDMNVVSEKLLDDEDHAVDE